MERALLGSGKEHFSFYKRNRCSVVRKCNLRIVLSKTQRQMLWQTDHLNSKKSSLKVRHQPNPDINYPDFTDGSKAIKFYLVF